MPATASKPLATFRGWNADALYLTDNGRALCGADLGSSAMHTGRDISGQKIERVTPDDVREARSLYGWDIACEQCGKQASTLRLPA